MIGLDFAVSVSTLRRWEHKGWIKDVRTPELSRLSWILLTEKGFIEA